MGVSYPTYQKYTVTSSPNEITIAATANSAGKYIAPFVAQANLSASATVAALQQEVVSISGINRTFSTTLSPADAVKLLNAFDISGWGPDISGGNFAIKLGDKDAFRQVIKAALDTAKDVSSNNTVSIDTWFSADIAAQLAVNLQKDGLANEVENQYAKVSSLMDTSGGALDAGNQLVDNPDYAETILAQIPNGGETYGLMAYVDASEEPITTSMPMCKGDTFVLVFDVTVGNVKVAYMQYNPGSVGTGASETSVSGKYDASVTSWTPGARRIALEIVLATGSGPFTVNRQSQKLVV